jgi:hypothetical protein
MGTLGELEDGPRGTTVMGLARVIVRFAPMRWRSGSSVMHLVARVSGADHGGLSVAASSGLRERP